MEATETLETVAIPSIEPDWNDIQSRYLQGEAIKTIAQDHNTTVSAISNRAWRYHWKAQQFKQLERDKIEVEREVKGCITVSILREARAFQNEETPAEASERDAMSRCRLRLVETASKLFGWDADPVQRAKPVKCLDV